MTRLLLAITTTLPLLAAGLAGPAPGENDAALERRVLAFSQQMRCLVCQNETLADSQAELAVDLRREIRAQMAAGRSDAEITAYLTARYGDFIRYRPALKPLTYALWFGPFALLVAALVALYRSLGATATRELPSLPLAARRQARQLLDGRRAR